MPYDAKVSVTLVSGDPLLKCQRDLCKNGGTCYLTSESINDYGCNVGETYFNDKCYRLYLDTQTWDVAQDRCMEAGGHLVTIDNNDESAFVQYFLLEQTRNLTAPFRDIGIWIGGRSVLNHTEPIYVWKPENYLITEYHWQQNEPNIYVDYTNVCIFVDYQNRYHQWRTGLCTAEKYFTCQRNIISAAKKRMIAQCYCPEGYFGEQCEFYNEAGGNVEGHHYACGHEQFHLQCPNEQKIHIDFAMFGNFGEPKNICRNHVDHIITNLTCIHSDSLQRLIALCEGLDRCSLSVPSNYFSKQPCFSSSEYLNYRYRCLADESAACPNNMIYVDGRCYQLNFDEDSVSLATWTEANQDCMKEGGLLASTITSNIHNRLVSAAASDSAVLNDFWINVRSTTRGDIVVGEDRRLDFVPENSTIVANSSCVYYKYDANISSDAFWESGNCSSKKHWICELGPELQKRLMEEYEKTEPQRTVFNGTIP